VEKKESIDSIFHYHLATEAQRAEILKPQDYIWRYIYIYFFFYFHTFRLFKWNGVCRRKSAGCYYTW